MIEDFWKLEQSNYNKEQLKNLIKEHYGEDFIDDYTKWKTNLDALNNDAKIKISHIVPESDFTEMKYDEFCNKIIEELEYVVDKKSTIKANDIIIISENVLNYIISDNINSYNIKYTSLEGIIDSVKKVVIK